MPWFRRWTGFVERSLARETFGTTTERYRAAFEPIVRNAADALHDAGSAVSSALERRIRSTLLAAMADRRLRADLAAGRLTGEHTDPGFAVLSQGSIPAEFLRDRPAKAPPAPTPIHKGTTTRAAHASEPSELRAPSSRRQRSREGAEERRRAQQYGRDAHQAPRQAQRAASALSRDARQKERAAQAAENRVAAARRALHELEQQGAARRAEADQARQGAEKAQERARAAKSQSD
jgi:hypothetical protein